MFKKNMMSESPSETHALSAIIVSTRSRKLALKEMNVRVVLSNIMMNVVKLKFEMSMSLGTTIIVTNAEEPWVIDSTRLYMPRGSQAVYQKSVPAS